MSTFICEKIENCFSDSETYAYALDDQIDEGFLAFLERYGNLEVKRNFRRPFYILRLPGGTDARGTLGDDRMKASFPNQDLDGAKSRFESMLSGALSNRGNR